MLQHLSWFVLIATAHGLLAADVPDECKRPPIPKARFYECCDVPPLISAEDKQACGFSRDGPPRHPKPPGPPPCDKDICVLKKLEIISGEDKVDKEAAKKYIDTILGSDPQFSALADSLKSKCIDADLAAEGPPDACEPMKTMHCFTKTMLVECPKWKEADECTEMKQHIEKCKQYFLKRD